VLKGPIAIPALEVASELLHPSEPVPPVPPQELAFVEDHVN
jgi:hypothetical protein